MIEYSLNGAWGKTIPDENLKKALADFGVELDVEVRRDGLSYVKIKIDDEKILKKKREPVVEKAVLRMLLKKSKKLKKHQQKKLQKDLHSNFFYSVFILLILALIDTNMGLPRMDSPKQGWMRLIRVSSTPRFL